MASSQPNMDGIEMSEAKSAAFGVGVVGMLITDRDWRHVRKVLGHLDRALVALSARGIVVDLIVSTRQRDTKARQQLQLHCPKRIRRFQIIDAVYDAQFNGHFHSEDVLNAICAQRNAVRAVAAANTEYEWLVFLDSDIYLQSTTIDLLLRTRRYCVGALYQPRWSQHVVVGCTQGDKCRGVVIGSETRLQLLLDGHFLPDPPHDAYHVPLPSTMTATASDTTPVPSFPCSILGFGAMLIRRELLHVPYVIAESTGGVRGEDIGFCLALVATKRPEYRPYFLARHVVHHLSGGSHSFVPFISADHIYNPSRPYFIPSTATASTDASESSHAPSTTSSTSAHSTAVPNGLSNGAPSTATETKESGKGIDDSDDDNDDDEDDEEDGQGDENGEWSGVELEAHSPDGDDDNYDDERYRSRYWPANTNANIATNDTTPATSKSSLSSHESIPGTSGASNAIGYALLTHIRNNQLFWVENDLPIEWVVVANPAADSIPRASVTNDPFADYNWQSAVTPHLFTSRVPRTSSLSSRVSFQAVSVAADGSTSTPSSTTAPTNGFLLQLAPAAAASTSSGVTDGPFLHDRAIAAAQRQDPPPILMERLTYGMPLHMMTADIDMDAAIITRTTAAHPPSTILPRVR